VSTRLPICARGGTLLVSRSEAALFRTPALFALFILGMVTSGCALVGGSPPERYGGSATLTQAANEASKDSTEKHKRLDVGDEAPPAWGGTAVGVDATSDYSETPPASSGHGGGGGDPTHLVLGVIAGGGSLGGQEFEGFGFGGLAIGAFVSNRIRFDIGGMFLSPNLSATSVAGQGLKDEFELAADLSGRYYLTPPHTFLGVYPLIGMRVGTLFWGYRAPVNVIADGQTKTITDDWLNYWSMYGGLGVSLVQTRNFLTGVHLTGGFREYDESTFEGFHNTLFPTTGYSQLTFEMTLKF
jgi:hypothetical protein